MNDKFFLSKNQIEIINDWKISKNKPLIIYGQNGCGKSTLAREILKDSVIKTIDSLYLKNNENLYEEIYDCIKKNNITMMFSQGVKKRSLILDDLDIFSKHDKKSFKSIISFISEYNYYNCKVIIICNDKFIINRTISKIKSFKLKLEYNISQYYKIAKNILIENSKNINFEEINKLLNKSKYNLNIFKSNIKETKCDSIDNFDNSDILYKDIIHFKYELTDILRIYRNEKITISLNLLENISKYITDIDTISKIYKNFELSDIIETKYINYTDISGYYIILTIYYIKNLLKKINNNKYYNLINNKYISRSLICTYNKKNKIQENYFINLCLYSIKINQWNETIKKELKKLNKKELESLINSFNYFYDSSLKIKNILKIIN
jgi:hypothetical protein